MKKTADLHSDVELLRREIKKITARINSRTSLDDLDRTWATLWRLQEALAKLRAKALAD